MKRIALLFTLAFISVLMTNCKKCNNDNPTARIVNNGTGEADVQIKDAEGSIVSISDLPSGNISSIKQYASGEATISYTIENVEKTKTILLNTCVNYDITINSENAIVIFSTEKG